MANNVRHGKRLYKQMSLEVAVRNPERYEVILKTFAKFDGVILDDEAILDIYSQLYIDEVVTADALNGKNLTKELVSKWITNKCIHNNEWGFPTGYQAAFTRYLKTLSEFGFIYAQYNQVFRLSPVAKALVEGVVTLSEVFALQCMRFWRKSPYRRVLNDFNFFEFIIDAMIELKKGGHRLSYYQLMVGLFSEDGNVNDFLDLIKENKVGSDADKAYALVKRKYSQVDKEHAKVAKLTSAFRDYGNTVFRVLQLTGFVTVEYSGNLMLTPNESRMPLYRALKAKRFSISESAKEDEQEYFEQLGGFGNDIKSLLISQRENADYSTAEYNKKLPNIINSYGLTQDGIEKALINVSNGETNGKDVFWYIQAPVKFEFLLTLFVYSHFGDTFIYKPNYICDEAGIPYSHAPGNIGDIEVFNKDKYWLIEATLIRSKNQQINNETVNLFRHLDETKDGRKFLTLIAPYVHDDTKLIFNVASIITMKNSNMISLNTDAITTREFIDDMKNESYFETISSRTQKFIYDIRDFLNSVNNTDSNTDNVRYSVHGEDKLNPFSIAAEERT